MRTIDKKLCEACKNGSFSQVKKLVEKRSMLGSANINIKEDGIGNTPLIISSAKGFLEIVEYLLNKGACINDLNRNLESALIGALKNNKIEIAKLLVRSGADLSFKDTNENTVLHLAIVSGQIELVKLFIESVCLSDRNGDGLTALDLAILHNNNEIKNLLASVGAPTNQEDIESFISKKQVKTTSYDEIINDSELLQSVCLNCGGESGTSKYYCYYGKIKGTYQQGLNQISEYEFNKDPITGHICKHCIKQNRKSFTKWLVLNISALSFAVLLAILFHNLSYSGWKVFFIIVSVFLGMLLVALFSLAYQGDDEIGDRLMCYNYINKLKALGYTTTASRKGLREKRYDPIPMNY